MQYPPPQYPPPPPQGQGRRVATGVGVSTIVALVFFSLLGPVARGCNQKMAVDKKQLEASLPKVGSEGTLAKSNGAARLCTPGQNKFSFAWPCGSKATKVDASSRVRVMKAGVEQMEARCRYWVVAGADANASGDAPCDWFVAQ